MAKKPRIPLLTFDNGVVIGVNDIVYISYVGDTGKGLGPYHLRSFATADKTRLFIQIDATAQVPVPEINMPIRITWPITDKHEGYTFASKLIGISEPDKETGFISLVIQTPDPKEVRKIDNRRDGIRLSARWPATIGWTSDKGKNYEIEGIVHNISFAGCSVHIPNASIEALETIEAVVSYCTSGRFTISMRPLLHLINATEDDDPAVIYKPFTDIETLTRGRLNIVHDGDKVQVISLQLIYERRQVNQLLTAMQLPKRSG